MLYIMMLFSLLQIVACRKIDTIPEKDSGKVNILCTTEMISNLVEQIGKEYVEVHTLIAPGLNPHTYEFVKGDGEKLEDAAIIFYNGLGLEHTPSLHYRLKSHPLSIPVGDEILRQFPEEIITHNKVVDPHIWMDISLWKKTVPFIVKALSKHDEEHSAIYQENGRILEESLEKAHNAIKEKFKKLPSEKRYLVSSHDAFCYFARAYLATDEERTLNTWQIRCAAPEGLAPESQISALNISAIIQHVKEYGITTIFTEANVNKDSIYKICDAANKMGITLKIATEALYSDSMGSGTSYTKEYLNMIQHNADIIHSYLNADE